MVVHFEPRNPELYAVLRSSFKEVRVQAQGMPFLYTIERGNNGCKIRRISGGEEYTVCCPFCGDNRFRLNVNHMFGARVKEGLQVYYSAHCWNEGCEVIPYLKGLIERARHYEMFNCSEGPVISGVEEWGYSFERAAEDSGNQVQRLDGLVPLNQLTSDHPAVKYLVSRSFSVEESCKWFGLQYCVDGPRFVRKRLVFPIFYNKKFIGYQARQIPGHTHRVSFKRIPKYFTSPGYKRSFFVHNYDISVKFNYVILVEGPTHVMRIGPPAIALLGRTLAEMQSVLVADSWVDESKPIIMIADPGFMEDWKKNATKLAAKVGGKDRIILIDPKDRDAGDYGSMEIWQLISKCCRERGYNVERPDIDYGVSTI